MVAFFFARPHVRADITGALTAVEDIERIVQRFSMGRGDLSDLLAVNRTIRAWSTVVQRFKEEKAMETVEQIRLFEADWTSFDVLMSRMTDLQDLSNRIATALDDDNSSTLGGSSMSENIEADDDRLDNTLPIEVDDSLWRYGSGKWMIKPEYPALSVPLYRVLSKFK